MKTKTIIKTISIFALVLLFAFCCIMAISLPRIDMDVIHEYNSIAELEKETGLKYYDLFNFKSYIEENKKELLREKKDFVFHFNEETPTCYSMFSPVEDNNQYEIDFNFTGYLSYKDCQIEYINDYTLYCHTYDDDRMYFIAISNQFKYGFLYKNSKNLEESYIIEKAKEYVQMNYNYHNQ